MKRKIFLIFTLLFAAVILFHPPAGASTTGVSVNAGVNGAALSGARLRGGVSYIPIRAFAEALGMEVSWNARTSTASLSGKGITLTVAKNSHYVVSNETYIFMSDGVMMVDGRMLVPSRTLAAALSLTADWNAHTRTVSFSGNPAAPVKNYDADEVLWLSRIIEAESGGEPFLGKIAVGAVVMNRVKSPEYPNTIYGVIFDRKYGVQFEPTINGTIYCNPSSSSIVAAKLCLDGANVVGKSKFFLNPSLADDTWFRENLTYVATIGGHVFYA